MTTLFRRRKPSSMEACTTLVMFLENATRGELAIRRMAVEKAGSGRISSQSSSNEVSRPAIRFRAFRAIAGKGGSFSGRHAGCAVCSAVAEEVAMTMPTVFNRQFGQFGLGAGSYEPRASSHERTAKMKTAEDEVDAEELGGQYVKSRRLCSQRPLWFSFCLLI